MQRLQIKRATTSVVIRRSKKRRCGARMERETECTECDRSLVRGRHDAISLAKLFRFLY